MPPTGTSTSMVTTCDCRAAAHQLSTQDDNANNPNQNEPHNPVPSTVSFSSPNGPSSSSSPSAALLQGRAVTAHWTHLSTTCPNFPRHLTSPTILRAMTTALERVTKKYEIHLWKMVFAKTTGPGTGTHPNLVPNLYPGLQRVGGGASASGGMTGHMGAYQLEEDEAEILVQEALRTSIEELGSVLSQIQKRVGLITSAEGMLLTGVYPGVDGGDYAGHLLGSTGIGRGGGLYDGTSLDGEIQMGSTDGEFGREMEGTLPTDEEMGEINVRLYGCLRRLDFLETGEVGK